MKFNDDMIRRRLPADVMALIHDLAYYTGKWPIEGYVLRAQQILKRKKSPFVKGYSLPGELEEGCQWR